MLIFSSCFTSGPNIIYKKAKSKVISLKAKVSPYIINFRALYANTPKLDLQAFV